MGCNCATQEQIKKLHQLYGEKSNLNKTFTQKIKEFFTGLLVYLILFLISPLIIGFVLYKFFFTKGKHTITVEMQEEAFVLASVILKAPENVLNYDEVSSKYNKSDYYILISLSKKCLIAE